MNRRWLCLIALGAIGLGSPPFASAQLSIEHARLECIAPGTYAVVLSGIDPRDEIQTAKVYFRSSLYPDFYYVEMERRGEDFVGILPQPAAETPGVVYYLEAVDSTFSSMRSDAFEVPVEEPCEDQPVAVLQEDEMRIVVGATTPGASAIPPGFRAAGIVGAITAAGVAGSVGGGLGAGAGVVVAAAGAAGAAGAVVVATSDGGDTTTTTSVTGGPPPPPGPGTTTTVPGTTTIPGPTTTVPGPTTTTTMPGPTTTTVPAPTTTTTSTTSTTTTTAPPLDLSCFDGDNVSSPSACTVRVDATCIQPPADRYDWVLDDQDRWQRKVISNGSAIETGTWGLLEGCPLFGETLHFVLTVTRDGEVQTKTVTQNVKGTLGQKEPARSLAVPLSLETHLSVPPGDGSARGRVLLDGVVLREVDSSQPVRITARGVPGSRTVEGVVASPGQAPGTWRFSLAEGLIVPGSFRIVAGTALSVAPDAVVFRVGGEPGERVAFAFELAR